MSKQTQVNASQNRENKKAEFSKPTKKKSGWSAAVILAVVAIVALASYLTIGRSGDKPASSTVTSTSQNSGAPSAGDIRIPVSDIESGKAKFFDYKTPDNKPVRFFAVKSFDGTYRAALDACEVCFHAKQGYHQEGDDMVCNNCSKHFATSLVGEIKGGCHPIGLARTVENGQLVIKGSELQSGGHYF